MTKPYKEGSTWSFRLRIGEEDIHRNGFATKAIAQRKLDALRNKLKYGAKPAHQGPWRTTLGEALIDYGLEHLPKLKGAVQDAVRINRYLRLAGLPIFKAIALEEEPHSEDKKVAHFRVELEAADGPRKIPQGLDEHRQKQADSTLRSDALRKRLAGTCVYDITSHEIQKLIDTVGQEGKGAATIRLEHAMLRHFFNLAIDTWKWPLEGGNPAVKRKLPKVDNARDRVLSNKEWEAITEELQRTRNPWVSNALALLLETAMRSSEALLRAHWGDVDEEACLLTLRDAKAGSRKVPMGPGAMQVIGQLRAHAQSYGPISPSMPLFRLTYEALRAAWDRVCERAGVIGVLLHDLRHTAATRFTLELNGNMPVLKVITGHKTDSQLLRYINIKPTDVSRLLHGSL